MRYSKYVLASVVIVLVGLFSFLSLAQPSEPQITVENTTVAPGEKKKIPMRLSEASEGLAGFYINLSIQDSRIINLTGVEVSDKFGLDEVSVKENEFSIKGVDIKEKIEPGAKNIVLASLTIRGKSSGSTVLNTETIQMDDDQGRKIIAKSSDGIVTVESSKTGGNLYLYILTLVLALLALTFILSRN